LYGGKGHWSGALRFARIYESVEGGQVTNEKVGGENLMTGAPLEEKGRSQGQHPSGKMGQGAGKY